MWEAKKVELKITLNDQQHCTIENKKKKKMIIKWLEMWSLFFLYYIYQGKNNGQQLDSIKSITFFETFTQSVGALGIHLKKMFLSYQNISSFSFSSSSSSSSRMWITFTTIIIHISGPLTAFHWAIKEEDDDDEEKNYLDKIRLTSDFLFLSLFFLFLFTAWCQLVYCILLMEIEQATEWAN